MNALRFFLFLGLMLGLTASTDAADGAKKKKKGKRAAVTGIVKEVQINNDNPNTGSLKIQAVARKKNKGAPAGGEKTITVVADTKVQKIDARPKKQKGAKRQLPEGQPAKLSDIQPNSRVMIALQRGSETTADRVLIVPARKKKNAANE